MRVKKTRQNNKLGLDLAEKPLTKAKLSHISRGHADIGETHDQNHETPPGLGSRARVVVTVAYLNPKPRP